jgi:ATP-binding cassette, subfamily G (WHITE), member 2, PDR
MFDNLLFLSVEKAVYFGTLGPNSRVLIDYFEKQGARRCGES